MKLLKSIFWLGLAFIVIKPADIDIQTTAQQAGSIATKAGKQIIIDQLTSNQCDNFQCSSSKALTLASSFIAKQNENKENNMPQISEPEFKAKIIAPIPRERIKRNS